LNINLSNEPEEGSLGNGIPLMYYISAEYKENPSFTPQYNSN
jgi:hypothetical protein